MTGPIKHHPRNPAIGFLRRLKEGIQTKNKRITIGKTYTLYQQKENPSGASYILDNFDRVFIPGLNGLHDGPDGLKSNRYWEKWGLFDEVYAHFPDPNEGDWGSTHITDALSYCVVAGRGVGKTLFIQQQEDKIMSSHTKPLDIQENVTLVNGNPIKNLDIDDLLGLIRTENMKLEQLKSYGISSKTLDKLTNKIDQGINLLVRELDSREV